LNAEISKILTQRYFADFSFIKAVPQKQRTVIVKFTTIVTQLPYMTLIGNIFS